MDLGISVLKEGDYALMVLHGRIDATHSDIFLRKLTHILISGIPNILIDFTHVTMLSSMGLGAVIEAKNYTTSNGGKFIVIGLNKTVTQVFELIGILEYLEVCQTVDEAISRIHPQPAHV